jgi:RNA polymerase sigma-70 factor (sigma-E family)
VDGTAVARGVDAALGERAEVRDDQTFAALFAARRDAIVRLAYVLTGDGHLAEEAAADAFAATYPRWKAGKVDDPDAYLRRAVVNQIRGRFRRNATRRRFEQRPHAATDTPASDSGVAERDLIRSALLALPIGQRAVVALRFLEDRSEAETAAVLGISTGTVKSQAARGLEHLRAAVGELEPGDR